MKKHDFLYVVFFLFITTNNSHAYLDPGSASIIFQALAGILGSAILFLGKINNFIERILKTKNLNTFIVLNLSIFPIWIFKSSFNFNLLILTFLTIYLLPLIILIFFFNNVSSYSSSNELSFTQKIILSIIILYGVDLNTGLWSLINFLPLHGKDLYIFSFIFVIVGWIILYYFIKKSYFKYLLVFLTFIFLYNLISQERNLNNLNAKISFDNYNQDISIEKFKKKKNPTLFVILDEMNGVGGLDETIVNFEKARDSFFELKKNHNFNLYLNSYTTIPGTLSSIPRMLNFDISYNEPYYNNYIVDHNEYFFWKKQIKNKLFDNFEGYRIYVKQTLSIDFCANPNVITCDTFNPYSKKVINQNNYKNPKLTEFISKFTYQNSILSRFFSRLLVELNLAELSISPRSDKAYFKNDLENLLKVIENNYFDLYFIHFLVPHKPFGFDKNCDYKSFGVLKNNKTFMKTQHNQEIFCTNLFFNNFFKKMKKLKKFDDFKIILVSDHGSRNTNDPNEYFSVVSITKKPGQSGGIIKDIVSVQNIVSTFFENEAEIDDKSHKYYNYEKKEFKEVNFE